MSKKDIKFAIILSGCGFKDGAEIQEATMSMLAIKQAGADYQCFAPDIDQHHVTNHYTGEPMQEKRNCLIESARIARGDIKPLSEFSSSDFDALLFPGGFGAALNLCTFAVEGKDCRVDSQVQRSVLDMRRDGKPIGALCIAPVILGKLLEGVKVTVGQDEGVNEALKCMGAVPENTKAEETIIDEENKVVTGPCYMLDSNILEIANGAKNVVDHMMKWL